MTCDAVLRSLSEFVDGELPIERRDAVIRHLDACPRCRRVHEELADLSHRIRAAPQPRLPEGFEARVRAGLRGQSRMRRARAGKRVAIAIAPLLSATAAAAITAFILAGPSGGGKGITDPLADVLTAHVRLLLDEQPARIASDDSHSVRPWFAGRLDFAPAAPDLRAERFALEGGRLDYVSQQMVAALVYRRRQHVISVFAARENGSAFPLEQPAAKRHGYNLLGWQADGVSYIAVSDLNADELAAFRTLFEANLPKRP